MFNKLKIPHIIGMIVAGVVIGPYGFNILDRDSSFAIFGQVGLLYLMFLAGLEIDMFHLRLNLRKGLVFGLLTLFLPLGLGIFSSVWLLGQDWTTSMLLGAMYASHTLLSYPIVARFGLTRTPAVLISVVGTIIAVIGALVVIAVTVNIHREGAFDALALGILVAQMAVYCGVVLYTFPRVTRWFFKRYSEKVTQYVFVLTLVFLASWMASLINLEPVLGAFFAGLVLNRFVPSGSPLMGSIEFVGNALFIPYFLISVGMMINLRVTFEVATLQVAAVMLAVAFLGKWLPAYIAQRVYGMTAAGRRVIFGLTTAHTAVALAVVTLGHALGMLDIKILNATILIILLTCAVSPIITAASAPSLKIQAMHAQEEEYAGVHGPRGDSLRLRVNNTLIPVANEQTARELAEWAVLMRNHTHKHNIHALYVRNDNSPKARRLSRRNLDLAAGTASQADVTIETVERFDLNIVTGILNVIEERDITEVILGLHRRSSFVDSFFGSKVEQLLRTTNKMIIITRCYIPLNTITRIVVWVPPKAQYETGFSRWVRALGRLARQLGCRVIFCSPTDVQPLVRGVLYQANYRIRCEFRDAENWDEMLTRTDHIQPDDLFVTIGARPASLSYSDDIAGMPDFLNKHFKGTNIAVIYPEQFGQEVPLTSFTDPTFSDINSATAPMMRRIKGWMRRFTGSY